jgi:hypothetical protein
MSFYPLFDLNEAKGFISIPNFSVNNWEKTHNGIKTIYSFRISKNSTWDVHNFGPIAENDFFNITTDELNENLSYEMIDDIIIGDLILFQLRNENLGSCLIELPNPDFESTKWPEWRATIGFACENAKVSYQGEINPTPANATLLTFHPFIQFVGIKNYFVFVNVEKSPIERWSEIEIFDSRTGKKIDTKKVRNNSVNIIPLDKYDFTPLDLPVFYCKSMAGIPFGFGKAITTDMMSLEHTHPPASLTLHGNRMVAQKNIKVAWANYLGIKNN